MAAIKLDIVWPPHFPDKFVTFGSDLRLYDWSVVSSSNLDPINPFNEDCRIPKLLSVNSDHQYIKCVSWCPREDYEHLIAVGLASGKVNLTSFNEHEDPNRLIGKEFVPRHARQCNALSWNELDTSLLAAGFEKYRGDCGLLVWDINKSSNSYTGDFERRTILGNYEPPNTYSKAIYEHGNSEIVHSLQWFKNQAKVLVVGWNSRAIKVIDIRDINRQSAFASTKSVYGITVDPFNANRLASYFENQVFVWDIRSFDKPVVTINETGAVVKIAWCPWRPNLVCSLSKDSTHLKLFDIQHSGTGNDELEPSVVERRLTSYGQRPLVSFCWHPFNESNLFAVNCISEIHSHGVCERITLKWSTSNSLVWTQSKNVINILEQASDSENLFDDLAIKIRSRVLNGYGCDIKKNIELVNDDRHLQNAWRWLEQKLKDEGKFAGPKGNCTLGVHEIICKGDAERDRGSTSNYLGSSGNNKSECIAQQWSGLPNQNISVKIYKSGARDRALQLCGWSIDKDGINTMLDRLEASDCYEKAAAIAVFNMRLFKAIQILQKGAQKVTTQGNSGVSLAMIALAMSGFTEEKISLWREMCDKLRPQLQDPYLRAMFAFLSSENDVYEDVLKEDGIAIQDRVAFACIFLQDQKLYEYLNKITYRMIDGGRLEGLLLTGLGKQGVELIQKFVDHCGDVQSAVLIVLQSLPSDSSADLRVQCWMESYRQLLDAWKLWHYRAKFDVWWHKTDPTWKNTHQVYVICHYCQKTISPLVYLLAKGKANYNGVPGGFNKTKVSVCLSCRKSLPRCSLCLIHMGSPAGTLGLKSSEIKINTPRENKLGIFEDWFTWCQTCRHGGHADHIDSWFKNHVECPVTSCNCKCMSLDSINCL